MSQAQDVEKQLRTMILDMALAPGERITERWAESQLGASRTSVRAALMRLESEGLIMREGRGWMVTPIHLKEVEQLFDYREVLEVAAVRMAAVRADIDDLDALQALLDDCGPGTPRELAHQLGADFHVQLARLSGNEFIGRAVADAMNRLARARWLDARADHHGWDEHRSLLAALRRRDADQAAALISAHVHEGRDRLLTALQSDRRSLRARGVRLVE
ncbi:GntR family transcriptional regulator [Dyella sp.]|uniref:GntR family transcriptional regulator n=1 Tax=Dyella sp. TaxID=1869338 RepID=UPI002ED2931B